MWNLAAILFFFFLFRLYATCENDATAHVIESQAHTFFVTVARSHGKNLISGLNSVFPMVNEVFHARICLSYSLIPGQTFGKFVAMFGKDVSLCMTVA